MTRECRLARRIAGAALGAGAVAGALLGTAPSGARRAAELHRRRPRRVSSGVSAATSAYLFTHPDVNAFFTGLEGSPRDELRGQIQQYLDANPQVKAELNGIRQPLIDFKNCCGADDNIADQP